MTKKGTGSLALLGILALAACSDDPTGVGDLSEAEAQQLASAVLTTAFSVYALAQTAPATVAGPALAPYEYSYSWDGTVDCPGGGTVTAEAAVATSGDTETGEAAVEMEFTQVHSGCVVNAGTQPFTFNGNPSVVVEITYEADGDGNGSYAGGIDGALDYEFDGRSGTCAISYSYVGTTNLNDGSSSYSLTGSVCGVSMDYQYNVG